jgi:LysM repeat protein
MGSGTQDEQKETYFLVGKRRENNLDFQGAAVAYEKALEVNPRNASAHFELGLLYEQQLKDYAAAVYHYEQVKKLRPNSDRAQLVGPHITACEEELARTVALGPVSPAMRRDMESLAEENRRLKYQVDILTRRLTMLTNLPTPVASNPPAIAVRRDTPARRAPSLTRAPAPAPAPSPIGRAKAMTTYVIRHGDTLSAIARRHGVKLGAVLAANPHVDPRRLHVGQTVNVPPP